MGQIGKITKNTSVRETFRDMNIFEKDKMMIELKNSKKLYAKNIKRSSSLSTMLLMLIFVSIRFPELIVISVALSMTFILSAVYTYSYWKKYLVYKYSVQEFSKIWK